MGVAFALKGRAVKQKNHGNGNEDHEDEPIRKGAKRHGVDTF